MNPKDESKVRGDSDYYKRLAAKSARMRIKRNIDAEVKLDLEDWPEAKVPVRVKATDAGYDIYAAESANIKSGTSVTINTGVRLKSPIGYYYKVENRSSMLKRGLVLNPTIIDSTYTGLLKVTLNNTSYASEFVEEGERIAQLLFYPQINVDLRVVENLKSAKGERGDDGFGSSGR